MGKRHYVKMSKLTLADLLAWAQADRDNMNRMTDAFVRREKYREARIKDMAAHPECPYLGDIETLLYGYTPSSADDDGSHLDDKGEAS